MTKVAGCCFIICCTLFITKQLYADSCVIDQPFTIETSGEVVTDIILDTESLKMVLKTTPINNQPVNAYAETLMLDFLDKMNTQKIIVSYLIKH